MVDAKRDFARVVDNEMQIAITAVRYSQPVILPLDEITAAFY